MKPTDKNRQKKFDTVEEIQSAKSSSQVALENTEIQEHEAKKDFAQHTRHTPITKEWEAPPLPQSEIQPEPATPPQSTPSEQKNTITLPERPVEKINFLPHEPLPVNPWPGRIKTILLSITSLASVILLGTSLYFHDKSSRLEKSLSEAQSLLQTSRLEIEELRNKASSLEKPGIIHGHIVLKDAEGKRRPMAGVAVRLFEPDVITAHLEERARLLPPDAPPDISFLVSFFSLNLPKPTALAMTGTNGHFSITPPGDGPYVIQIGSIERNTRMLRLWLLKVDPYESPNTPIEISEKNEVRVFAPEFMIENAR